MAMSVEEKRVSHAASKRTWRLKKKSALGAAAGNGNVEGIEASNNELDAYGFPIGTHDAQGRKLGQLDDLEEERDKLTSELATYEKKREALEKEKYDVPLLSPSETLKQEIDTRAHLIAINELIKESDAKITEINDAINQKNPRIKQLEAEHKTAKKNRDDYCKGGRVYKDKMACAEYVLRDEKIKKKAAEATLKNSEHNHDAQVQIHCANANIAKYSNVEGQLAAERKKYEDLMRLYRR